MRTRLRLGLGRHAGTEAAGAGSSPGTRFLFSSLEESLRREFFLVRVPSYYYSMDARRSLLIAWDVLNEVDACIFGLPPHPVDLDAFFLMRSRMEKKIPFIYMPLGEFPRGAWFYRHIHRHLVPGDLVLFSCRADRAIHDALVESTPARVVVIPFGIHAARFHISPKARAATRRHLGIESADVVFVYHGRVTAEKNVHGAIMMFRRIAKDHPRARFWIIGEVDGQYACGLGPQRISQLTANPLTNVFRELLRGGDFDERVMFWNSLPQEALPEVLGAADIGINFTLNLDENFGYSAVEAMAAGLPVIGTDWGGLKDTIEDGITGFLVPTLMTPIGIAVDHWRAWRSALELVENVGRRLNMGAAATQHVAREFTLERFAASVASEVQAQISEDGTKSRLPHAWSPLGKRLADYYSTTLAATTQFRDDGLMQKIVQPYATSVQNGTPDPDAMFFLATDLLSVRGTSLRSKDPRYPLAGKSICEVDRELIRILKKRPFCDYSFLARRANGHFSDNSIRASLGRLLEAGIILQSKSTAE